MSAAEHGLARAVARIRSCLGDEAIREGGAAAPYMAEPRGLFPGRGEVVVRPADTAGVAEAVAICADEGVAIVPQGGRTGTVGGATARHAGEITLSLERLDRVRAVDAEDGLMTVEAGCTLAQVQQEAARAGAFFPLRLASEAECRVGGNLATNAGGLNVLRYGDARALTRGLEVVLADGRVWRELQGLRKDNAGYDLRDLFIGSEGTLGVITAATLRLLPPWRSRRVALLALEEPDPALPLVRATEAESGGAVTAAELMSAEALAMGQALPETPESPLPGAAWYLLLELASADPRAQLDEALGAALEPAQEAGRLMDAVVAPTEDAAERMWRLRTAIPDGQKHAGASIKHDISVLPRDIAAFIPRALAAVRAVDPEVRPCIFGHVGDGNLHFNLTQPRGSDPETFLRQQAHYNEAVHEVVRAFSGSIAAEHGVGQLRRAELQRTVDPVRRELMDRLKRALDPGAILNPGKGVVE